MAEIEYSETDEQGLDLIEALWQKLVEYHKARSQHFSRLFDRMTFDRRKEELLEKLVMLELLV